MQDSALELIGVWEYLTVQASISKLQIPGELDHLDVRAALTWFP
jgi:hypothetical protein